MHLKLLTKRANTIPFESAEKIPNVSFFHEDRLPPYPSEMADIIGVISI